MELDYGKMFSILEMYLQNKMQILDTTILQAVEARRNGKKFSFSEHLKGLVFSLLSSQRDWSEIHANRNYIEKLFFNFDKEKIKNCDYMYFVQELKAKKLANRAINQQMKTLRQNIEVLELIEMEYGSLDNFITKLRPNATAALFACKESPYALKQIGFALALEYLRNIGIDTTKPDVHIVRILQRLGLLAKCENSEKQAVEVIENLSKQTGYSIAHIDFLLWHFCSEGFGNVCSANPKCNKCPIKRFCNNTPADVRGMFD